MYQRYESSVLDGFAEKLYQPAVVDRVKELLKVKVNAVSVAVIDDCLCLLQGLMRAPSRAEAEAASRELWLVYQA